MSLCAFYQGRLAFICLCDSDGEANIAIDFYYEKLRHLTDSGTALRVYTVAHELFPLNCQPIFMVRLTIGYRHAIIFHIGGEHREDKRAITCTL